MMRSNGALPRIARATSPSYPDRIVIAFFGGNDVRHQIFATTAERDAYIEEVIAEGIAEHVHTHCGTPGCPGVFARLTLREGPDGNLVFGRPVPL